MKVKVKCHFKKKGGWSALGVCSLLHWPRVLIIQFIPRFNIRDDPVSGLTGIAILKITLFIASTVSYYYFLFSEVRYFNYFWLNKFTLYINHLVVKKTQKPEWTTKQKGANHEKSCGHIGPPVPGKDRGVGGGTDSRIWYLNILLFLFLSVFSHLCFSVLFISHSCCHGAGRDYFFLVAIWKSPERNSVITARLITRVHCGHVMGEGSRAQFPGEGRGWWANTTVNVCLLYLTNKPSVSKFQKHITIWLQE